MKKLLCGFCGLVALSMTVQAQVLLSSGLTYSQNFDTLATSSTTAQPSWTDNSTLLGWYAQRAVGTPTTYGSLRLSAGGENNGAVYDYGSFNSTDRALGSVGSGTPKTNVFGVEIRNDTGSAVSLASISYTGEQWRIGQGNINKTNVLWFTYQTGSSPINNPTPGNEAGWTPFNALSFTNLVFSNNSTETAGTAIDGNAAGNNIALSSTFTGITLNANDEIFLRWIDPDESGNDMGLAVDNLVVNFQQVVVPEPQVLSLLGGFGLLALFIRRRK